jgi:hypothetical protein
MEHPVFHCTGVANLLNHLIRESVECLFVGFSCLPIIAGIAVRPRPPPPRANKVLTLLQGHALPREPDPGRQPFEAHPDP